MKHTENDDVKSRDWDQVENSHFMNMNEGLASMKKSFYDDHLFV